MLLAVVRVYQQGRKLSERDLRNAVGVVGDVRIQVVQAQDGRPVRQATCTALTTEGLPALIEAQLTGMIPVSLRLEGFEEVQTTGGVVFYRQGLAVQDAIERCTITEAVRTNYQRIPRPSLRTPRAVVGSLGLSSDKGRVRKRCWERLSAGLAPS